MQKIVQIMSNLCGIKDWCVVLKICRFFNKNVKKVKKCCSETVYSQISLLWAQK